MRASPESALERILASAQSVDGALTGSGARSQRRFGPRRHSDGDESGDRRPLHGSHHRTGRVSPGACALGVYDLKAEQAGIRADSDFEGCSWSSIASPRRIWVWRSPVPRPQRDRGCQRTPSMKLTAQLQTNYETRSLVDIPIAANGTAFINLSLLGAGIASSGGLGIGIGPSVGGQRPTRKSLFRGGRR